MITLSYLVAELVQEINPKKGRQFSVIHAIFDDFSKFRSAFGILLLLTKIIKGKSLKKSLVQHNIPSTHFLMDPKLLNLSIDSTTNLITKYFCSTSFVYKVLGVSRGWTYTIIILGAYSKVILLVLLSNFAQCLLPFVRLNPVAQIPWAPSTAQNLKVTIIEWLLNMLLMMIVKVHRLCIFAMNAKI